MKYIRYIRTKNSVYEVAKIIQDFYDIYVVNVPKSKRDYDEDNKLLYKDSMTDSSWQNEIIKESDNIEDLCDEFVIHYAHSYHLITINDGEVSFKDNFDYGFKLKFALENDYEIYGEIWVDGELHKVAKMNSEGELELL